VAGELGRAAARVGHVKVRVATARGCARGSLVDDSGRVRYDESDPAPSDGATALINARVETDPAVLAAVVERAVEAAAQACGVRSTPLRTEVFRPGFPVPVHRM
jgi:hypothetical protein